MPYIKAHERPYFDSRLDRLRVENPGELNYVITRLCLNFLDDPNYEDYNTVIGALECAKLELYRRHLANYEDKKIAENGDVGGK